MPDWMASVDCDNGDSCGGFVLLLVAAEVTVTVFAAAGFGFGLLDDSRDLTITCIGIVMERLSTPESGDFSRADEEDVSSTSILSASASATATAAAFGSAIVPSLLAVVVTELDMPAPSPSSSVSCSSELSGETDSSSKILVGRRTSCVTFSEESFE